MEQDFYINIARKYANYSELLHKHCSIIICDNQIITGYNHFSCSKNCITVHAEEDAINNFIIYCRQKYYKDSYIRRKLRKALLITIRIKNQFIKDSTPCKNCIDLIKSYGIKQIIFSNSEPENNLTTKKIRDIENRPSSGYRWRIHNKTI